MISAPICHGVSDFEKLHAQLIKSGKPLSRLPLDRVGEAFCNASPGDFDYARRVIRSASSKAEIFNWNASLDALASSGSPIDALQLFSRMIEAGLRPDRLTCSFAMKACSRSGEIAFGKAVHCIVEKLLLGRDVYLDNVILHMYASCGCRESAGLLFDKMPLKDVVSWNILISHLCKSGELRTAREVFDRMPERSVRSWTSMIDGYVKCGKPRQAVALFREMEEVGVKPNEVTVVVILRACAEIGALDLGRRVHEYSSKCGFGGNTRIQNTLIDMYVKCGCLDLAKEVFEEMGKRTVVSWSAMIVGLAMFGQGEEALELFREMSRDGVKPNAVTFLGLLHACSHMGLVQEGRRFFSIMVEKYNIVPEIEHYGSMVDVLSRAGLLQEALEFIKNMPVSPNSVVWGALLGGAKLHRNVEIGEEAIRHLRRLDPLNDGYYVVLSNIYAEAGRWDDVVRVRKLMKELGVKKTVGWSSVTVDGVVHRFVAGDRDHPQLVEIQQKWEELLEEMKLRGYIPDTSAVLLDLEEEVKQSVLYTHSEKLAVTFGLLSTPPGVPIRIMKNLRICGDCHSAIKLISHISKRQIIVRDRNRFHCFSEGSCSCKDYW